MSAHDEQRETWQTFDAHGRRVRAGLRLDGSTPLLAGAPIGLTFSIELEGAQRLYLAVAGDRGRQRPAGFVFVAKLDEADAPLPDPLHGVPDSGGPLGLVEIGAETPWRQPLLLNQFVALEEGLRLIPPGERRTLRLSCRKSLELGPSEAAALDPTNATSVELSLSFALERDDEALAGIAAGLAATVSDGPIEERETALLRLLGMRAAAREQLRALTRHRQFSVAERARLALDALESVS
ncbi:hypothetical protein K4L06_17315 [Lysobacter sp. BMK333-48F3]|uniref:hypothetical protein n=1 Tax=Lysobacter sp. BMK333-48F3 TaxID=2867962 RepID=UPI001C8C3966|nr:hypothetical protein [Lysobacter sp. BMK333-48F3]MBX9403071.1 hypothetical protein [Lysobacter sp. BMK333-48F3]